MAGFFRRFSSPYVAVGLAAFALSAGLQAFSLFHGHSGRPEEMIRVAPASGDSSQTGQAGFDGQYFLRLAEDPLVSPATARALDAPALRARRIGLPLVGRLLALLTGSPAAGLLLTETASLALLIAVVQQGARAGRLSPFAGLAVPLILPFALSLELVTAELGTAALVLLAAHAARLRATPAMVGALAAACLFKEVGILAVAAFSLASFLQERKREALLTLTALLPWTGWQLYLSMRFGGGAGMGGLLTNLSIPGTGVLSALQTQLSALHAAVDLKAAGLLAATLWYIVGAVLALLLLRGGFTRGRLLAACGTLLVFVLSYGDTAQAFNEVFNFGRQLFLLPAGLLIILFEETPSLSIPLRRTLIAWLAAGSLLGIAWLLQEVLSLWR